MCARAVGMTTGFLSMTKFFWRYAFSFGRLQLDVGKCKITCDTHYFLGKPGALLKFTLPSAMVLRSLLAFFSHFHTLYK